MELAPPGFGNYAPVIYNREGRPTIVWWLVSDWDTAKAYADAFVERGFAHSGSAMEVLKPGLYQ